MPERASREPVVRLRGVSKKFPGVVAVDGVDLDEYCEDLRPTAP